MGIRGGGVTNTTPAEGPAFRVGLVGVGTPAAGGRPAGQGPGPPLPAPYRRDPLGAVPGRRTPRPLRRALPRPVLGRTPPPARRPPDGDRPGDRGGGVGLLRSAGHGRPPA